MANQTGHIMAEMVLKKQTMRRSTATPRKAGVPLQDNRNSGTGSLQLQDNRTPVQRNKTGLPDKLKNSIESLSGISMDQVRVHYNSAKPIKLQAHAYAQGKDIHLAPGQEKHLPHEAWHVVQQVQGRVKPTMQMKAGVAVNDEQGLEKEADQMGAQALQLAHTATGIAKPLARATPVGNVAQRNGDEHGLVPPSTHGRNASYTSPQDPKSTTKKHYHAVPRKGLTRFERMIDRIGRILATSTNVHVAVALDDKTLVLSVNKESEEAEEKLEKVAAKLKDVVTGQDPLSADKRITGTRRKKDLAKTKNLLEGKYTDDAVGVETNEEVSAQMKRLIAAINAGVITKKNYKSGNAGIYIVPTSTNSSDASQNMHGELKVTEAIMERRKTDGYQEKDVYIGGTLADCFACNASHKIANEEIRSLLQNNDWKFYSGGTHGGMFVGYRVSATVAKKKQRFKALTDEEVGSGDIPKVDAVGQESASSLNYDSDSDAEDVEELSAYAKERNKLITIQKSLKTSRDKLRTLGQQILAAQGKQSAMEQELEQLTPLVAGEKYQAQVLKAKQAFAQGLQDSAALQQLVEQKKQELEQATQALEDIRKAILSDSVVVGKTGKRPKPGVAVEFRGEKMGVKNWRTGEKNVSELQSLDTKYKYAETYNKIGPLRAQLVELGHADTKAAQSAQALEQNLHEAGAPARRLADLPGEIQKVKQDIEQLKVSSHATNEDITSNEEKEATAKTSRKAAAKHGSVTAVKDKLDWLNQATITADQTEGD